MVALAALVAVGCGDDGDDSEAATTTTSAADDAERLVVFEADLQPLNGDDALGAATFTLDGSELRVVLNASQVSPELAHAQHVHIGGDGECPAMGAAGEDGVLSTAEGIPAYGEVQLSLTSSGDTSPESALAVERFPVAGAEGELSYERSFPLPESVVADELDGAVVVVHGSSELGGDPAAYDGEARSSLDPALPLEATAPVLCGVLEAPID